MILKVMESFSETKKNMFFPIRDGIAEALTEMEELNKISDRRKGYLEPTFWDHWYYLSRELAKSERKKTEVRRVKGKANLVIGGASQPHHLRKSLLL